jgi:hypothetical protein
MYEEFLSQFLGFIPADHLRNEYLIAGRNINEDK